VALSIATKSPVLYTIAFLLSLLNALRGHVIELITRLRICNFLVVAASSLSIRSLELGDKFLPFIIQASIILN
jgi:hypothetical protein